MIFWERLRSRRPLLVLSSKLCSFLQSTFTGVSIILLTLRIDLVISKGNLRVGGIIKFLSTLDGFFIGAILHAMRNTATVSDVFNTLTGAYAVCVDALVEGKVFLTPWDCAGWTIFPTFVCKRSTISVLTDQLGSFGFPFPRQVLLMQKQDLGPQSVDGENREEKESCCRLRSLTRIVTMLAITTSATGAISISQPSAWQWPTCQI